jgi:hypothetical protein
MKETINKEKEESKPTLTSRLEDIDVVISKIEGKLFGSSSMPVVELTADFPPYIFIQGLIQKLEDIKTRLNAINETLRGL